LLLAKKQIKMQRRKTEEFLEKNCKIWDSYLDDESNNRATKRLMNNKKLRRN
jgi:hypothetical protein